MDAGSKNIGDHIGDRMASPESPHMNPHGITQEPAWIHTRTPMGSHMNPHGRGSRERIRSPRFWSSFCFADGARDHAPAHRLLRGPRPRREKLTRQAASSRTTFVEP